MAGSARKKMFCPECNTLKLESDFYRTNNKEKYPTGKLPTCKKCRTMMVNNWKPETFLDILKDCDVPYIPQEWNKLLERYATNPADCSGTTIIGRYLSKMQLNQFYGERWEDSEKWKEKLAEEIRIAMSAQGFTEEEIENAIKIDQTILPGPGCTIPELPSRPIIPVTPEVSTKSEIPIFQETYKENNKVDINQDGTVTNYDLIQNYFASDDDISYENDLTSEDKKILRLKWGKTYSVEELIRLEKLYREMEESFDIQNAGHRDTLIKVCKTSLKSEQLLDIGDIENAQKAVKMYEALMKAGNFTAVQNKVEQGECLDSISELVLLCERNGSIPRFYTTTPLDKVDETIADMKEYTADLFKGESNLESMIEAAVKQIHDQETREEDEDTEDEEEITLENIETVVKDEDFKEFYDFIEEEQEMSDESILNFLKGGKKLDDD